jgi:hypothetical protein
MTPAADWSASKQAFKGINLMHEFVHRETRNVISWPLGAVPLSRSPEAALRILRADRDSITWRTQ